MGETPGQQWDCGMSVSGWLGPLGEAHDEGRGGKNVWRLKEITARCVCP